MRWRHNCFFPCRICLLPIVTWGVFVKRKIRRVQLLKKSAYPSMGMKEENWRPVKYSKPSWWSLRGTQNSKWYMIIGGIWRKWLLILYTHVFREEQAWYKWRAKFLRDFSRCSGWSFVNDPEVNRSLHSWNMEHKWRSILLKFAPENW